MADCAIAASCPRRRHRPAVEDELDIAPDRRGASGPFEQLGVPPGRATATSSYCCANAERAGDPTILWGHRTPDGLDAVVTDTRLCVGPPARGAFGDGYRYATPISAILGAARWIEDACRDERAGWTTDPRTGRTRFAGVAKVAERAWVCPRHSEPAAEVLAWTTVLRKVWAQYRRRDRGPVAAPRRPSARLRPRRRRPCARVALAAIRHSTAATPLALPHATEMRAAAFRPTPRQRGARSA
jgi:hypothetical protein